MEKDIRNFAIIAHVDHGKSTLADRMLEETNTIEKRAMKEQVLDNMELERERGITIKLQPVSMKYKYKDREYTLNLIDTPGHIDFSYEVSRSLKAVEGVVLLVDSTQGVQAQTISVLEIAKEANLKIIPVLSKVDMQNSNVESTVNEIKKILGLNEVEVLRTSGKTGVGVEELLGKIIDCIPSPINKDREKKALVFDFSYSEHLGIIAYVRVLSGEYKRGEASKLIHAGEVFKLKETGIFSPERTPKESLTSGMIGYLTTGIKTPGIALVGDTITNKNGEVKAFEGYQSPQPVIFASLYPENIDDFTQFLHIMEKLKLSDASLSFKEEKLNILGKGLKCGFLGMLHLEIITEMVKRKLGTDLIITAPTTDYLVRYKNEREKIISTATEFPDKNEYNLIRELWADVSIITPNGHLGNISNLFLEYEGYVLEIIDFEADRKIVKGEMPLREFMRNFTDRIKGATSGYASVSYKKRGFRDADVGRLDILLAEEEFPAFSTIVSSNKSQADAKKMVNLIYENLSRTMFVIKIQARFNGRIIASKTLSALKKDVTAKLYGGDITRKMKLKEKQRKGKKERAQHSKVKVSNNTFLKVMRGRGV